MAVSYYDGVGRIVAVSWEEEDAPGGGLPDPFAPLLVTFNANAALPLTPVGARISFTTCGSCGDSVADHILLVGPRPPGSVCLIFMLWMPSVLNRRFPAYSHDRESAVGPTNCVQQGLGNRRRYFQPRADRLDSHCSGFGFASMNHLQLVVAVKVHDRGVPARYSSNRGDSISMASPLASGQPASGRPRCKSMTALRVSRPVPEWKIIRPRDPPAGGRHFGCMVEPRSPET